MSRRCRAEAFRRGRESSSWAAVARASAAATRAASAPSAASASAATWVRVRARRPPTATTATTASMGWRSSARKTGEAASGSVEVTADLSAGSAFASATAAS